MTETQISSIMLEWYNYTEHHAKDKSFTRTTFCRKTRKLIYEEFDDYRNVIKRAELIVSRLETNDFFEFLSSHECLIVQQKDYTVEVCDGSAWKLNLFHSNNSAVMLQGTVLYPPFGEDIEVKLRTFLKNAEIFEPCLFGCIQTHITKAQDGKDEFLFRKARREEADTVYALYRRAVGREFCAWDDEYPGMQEISEDLKTEQLYVLTHKDTVMGAISIVPEHELDDFSCWQCKDGSHQEIARFVLDQAFVGRGLSQRILREIMAVLRSMGCRAVHLSVAEKNIPAYKAYVKTGFRKAGEADLYGGHYFLMEKILEKDKR